MSKKDPVVYIGRFRIPWSGFKSSAKYFNDLYLEHPNTRLTVQDRDLVGKCVRHFAIVENFNGLRDCGPISTLETRLLISMLQEATDPRDHVYGILAIFDIGEDLLAPDYGLSVQHVFTKTTAILLEYYSPVLYCVYPLRSRLKGASARAAHTPDLPSWVPDLAARTTWKIYETKEDTYWAPVMLLRTPNIEPVLRPFMDGPKHPCIARFSEDYRTMNTIGTALGAITWVSIPDLFTGPGAERRLHNLYHRYAKKQRFTPAVFHQALHDLMHVILDPLDLQFFQDFLECDSVPEDIDPKFKEVMKDILRSASCRNFFVTDTGRFGQSYYPEKDGVRVGDVLVGLFGNNFPFILRPIGAEQYEMINVAYVVDHEWGELHPDIEIFEYNRWADLESCWLREYEII